MNYVEDQARLSSGFTNLGGSSLRNQLDKQRMESLPDFIDES
jgi:hypothetical protein